MMHGNRSQVHKSGGIWEEVVVVYLRHYFGFFLEGLRTIMQKTPVRIHSPRLGFERGTPEFESDASPLYQLQCNRTESW